MITLYVQMPGGPERPWCFDQEIVRIGRREDSDLVLSDDSVSRRHAQIEKRNKNYVVRDMNSRNGTRFDAKRIKKRTLADGDVILVGDTRIRFQLGGILPEDSPQDAAATVLDDRGKEPEEAPCTSAVPPAITTKRIDIGEIDKRSGSSSWHVSVEGGGMKVYGTDDLRELIRAGSIRPGAIAWTKGMRGGVAVSQIPELRVGVKKKDTAQSDEQPEKKQKEEMVEAYCPDCGERNRVPRNPRSDGHYKCGKCGRTLSLLSAKRAQSGPASPQASAVANSAKGKKCKYCGEPLELNALVCPLCNHSTVPSQDAGEEFRQRLKIQRELQEALEQDGMQDKPPPPSEKKSSFFKKVLKKKQG